MDLRGAHDPMDRAASRPTRAVRPWFRWRRADATGAHPESSQPRPRPPRRTHGSFPGPPHPARRPRDRRPRRRRAGRTGPRPQPAHAHGGHAGRGVAAPPPWARPRSPRRVAPHLGVGPRRVRRGTSRSVRDVPRYRGRRCSWAPRSGGVFRARRDAAIRDGRHGHGRVGARGRGCGSRPRAAGRATGRHRRPPARSRLVRARWTRAHPGGPARADLRGPVRLGRSDLQPRFPGRDALPDRSRGPAGSGHLRAGYCVAGRWPADRRGPWHPGAGTGVAGCRGPFRVRDPRAVARHDRGAHRPRRDRSHRCPFRRPAARLPVRRSTRWPLPA